MGINNKNTTLKLPNNKIISVVIIAVIVIVLFVFLTVYYNIIIKGSISLKNAYESAYDNSYNNTYGETYNKYRDEGFFEGEAKHHTKNEVNIIVDDIKKISELEVLKVSDFDYAVSNGTGNEQKINAIFEVYVFGAYKVNLKLSEFIVDNEHRTVIVRLPEPKLDNFTHKYNELYFSKDGIKNGSYGEGANFARIQINETENKIIENLKCNQENLISARESAKMCIENIIYTFNPDIPSTDIKVLFEDFSGNEW